MKKAFSLGLITFGLFATIIQAQATPQLTEILKKGVSQYEAAEICKAKGTRLPTALELAEVSQALGAKGITDDGMAVSGTDTEEIFYFNEEGYKRPAGELGEDYFFWSSSIDTMSSNYAFTLSGMHGFIFSYHRERKGTAYAVRCIRPL